MQDAAQTLPIAEMSSTSNNSIPENAPFRESSPSQNSDSKQIVEVSFTGSNTRKRESINNPPIRVPNSQRRSREFLTESEVEKLIVAAERKGRHGHRDAAMLLLAYRHGLRVSELVALRWDQIDFAQGLLHVRRVKNGTPSTHPIRGRELRTLRRLQRDYPTSPYLFCSERNAPLTPSSIRKIMARAGTVAGIGFPVHPHQLRHGTGFFLANSGQDTRAIQHYLGHRNICHTVRYTELSPDRFKNFWQD